MYGSCCLPTRHDPLSDWNFVLCVRGGTGGPCESCLPDTGITTCYAPEGERGPILPTPCDNPEFPGQDGAYASGRPREGRFYDCGDGTVIDVATGLMWFKETAAPPSGYDPDDEGRVTWQQALKYCEELEFAGYEDWRLPNLIELLSIMNLPPVERYSESTPPFVLKHREYWTSSAVNGLDSQGNPSCRVITVHRCPEVDHNPADADHRFHVLPLRDAYWP